MAVLTRTNSEMVSEGNPGGIPGSAQQHRNSTNPNRPVQGRDKRDATRDTLQQLAAAADGRHRLAWWQAQGLLPHDLPPCSIAAAYVRATGLQPPRDPSRKQSRAYSCAELLQALGQLAAELLRHKPAPAPAAVAAPPAPPPPPRPRPQPPERTLPELWQQAIRALELPSTRMLLSQQAELRALVHDGADDLVVVIAVVPQWRPMIQSRAGLLAQAFARVLSRPVAIRLVERLEVAR